MDNNNIIIERIDERFNEFNELSVYNVKYGIFFKGYNDWNIKPTSNHEVYVLAESELDAESKILNKYNTENKRAVVTEIKLKAKECKPNPTKELII